jgi:hypothetical protein
MLEIKPTAGSLMFISFDDLIMEFARYNDLGDYSILIASHEIAGSLKTRSVITGVSTGITYSSKYDNIEFVDSLRPTPSIMEYLYGGNRERFVEHYESHLLSSEPFTDICAIVDMVVNLGVDVLIVMASYEDAAQIPACLRDFIYDQFGLLGYVYGDLSRLVKYYDDKPTYEKIVKTIEFEVPEEFNGKNVRCIVDNIGDVEAIREKLVLQEQVAATISADPGKENDIVSIFFNRFTEDLEDKVKDLLLQRDLEDIKDICRDKRIRILPGATKDSLVEKILHEMRLNSRRVVEYETN